MANWGRVYLQRICREPICEGRVDGLHRCRKVIADPHTQNTTCNIFRVFHLLLLNIAGVLGWLKQIKMDKLSPNSASYSMLHMH